MPVETVMGIYSLNLVTARRLRDFDNNTSSSNLVATQASTLYISGSKIFRIPNCIVRDLTLLRLSYDLCYLYIQFPTEKH